MMKRLSSMFILVILACSACIDLTGEDSVKVFTLHIPSTIPRTLIIGLSSIPNQGKAAAETYEYYSVVKGYGI
jgi:hypothetical protein